MNFTAAEELMRAAVPDTTPAAQLVVRWRGDSVLDQCYGWLDPVARAADPCQYIV